MLNPKKLFRGFLTNSSVALYTVPDESGKFVIIKELLLCNTDSTARTVSINLVPSGGSVTDSNLVFDTITIQPQTTVIWELSTVLEQNEAIYGVASTTNVVVINLSGVAQE